MTTVWYLLPHHIVLGAGCGIFIGKYPSQSNQLATGAPRWCMTRYTGLLCAMPWVGLVWFGLVWFNLVWSGGLSCGLVWCGLVWFCLV